MKESNSEDKNIGQLAEAIDAGAFSFQNIAEQLHEKALQGDSYEDSASALGEVEALQEFRRRVSKFRFGSFSELIESATNINRLKTGDRKTQIASLIELMRSRVSRFSPRVSDFYLSILAQISGEPYQPRFGITQNKIDEMKKSGDFQAMFAGDISWEMKINRIETRLSDYLAGIRSLDKEEGGKMDDDIRKWRAEELRKAPTRPPARRQESQPGVDPMERLKEGEKSPSIWVIHPAWGGYFKEQSFSKWDSQRNVWVEDESTYSDVMTIPLSGNSNSKNGPIDITMSANVYAGAWVSIPVPYTHGLSKIEAGKKKFKVGQDQNGDLVLFVEGNGEAEVKVFLAPDPNKKFLARDPAKIKVPNMPSDYGEETRKKLEEISGEKRGNIERARAVERYILSRITYLSPKDRAEAERYNSIYRSSPKGFAGAVDEVKTGDCDVVNTYFAALCSELKIPVRHVVGHSVKGKDKEGKSHIHSGTGHGWSEVWDEVNREWARFDATPSGDPNLDSEDKSSSEDSAPGDYGGQEAVRPSDDRLKELREKLAKHTEELSYTREERQLAESASIELKEARQIVREIDEAERTRLANGELAIDALARLFNAIIESRKITVNTYEGPLRKREGGEAIQDIVRHKIGVLAGESDPMSREKPAEEVIEEQLLGGFDLYLSGDKSGSMGSTAQGETLLKIQRRAAYLIFSALYRFEKSLKRASLIKEKNLSVRTEGISFRGQAPEDIDLDKPLSGEFTAADKVKMWHSLSNLGSSNGDVAALSYIYEQIKGEIEEIEKSGGVDNRLRIVIACSDGGYVGAEAEMRNLAKILGKTKTIVVGLGLTESAASVPIVMHNPPHSYGEVIRDINDLPVVIAKYVILEAVKLFPEKAHDSAKRFVEMTLANFKNTK